MADYHEVRRAFRQDHFTRWMSESKFEFRLSEESFMRTNSGSHILGVPIMNHHLLAHGEGIMADYHDVRRVLRQDSLDSSVRASLRAGFLRIHLKN